MMRANKSQKTDSLANKNVQTLYRRTARRPGAQRLKAGATPGEPLELVREFRALRPGTGRGPKPADRAPSWRAAAESRSDVRRTSGARA